jgi:prophage antirepressor-like protein/phage antirepressor YoqD-like protein
MNTETQTFNFNSATLRTMTDAAGDPWFVLKDCMNILGLGNPTETVKMFDDDEFSTTEVIDSIGLRQQTYIISEAGLYGLVLKSRKPEAKEFQRWVTHEVLPTISKHGTANLTKKGNQISNDIVEVPFNGSMMIAKRFDDGEIYTALKPICENIGISYSGQWERLNRTPWATIRMMRTVGADGKHRDMVAVSRKTLTMWLATIDTSRLNDEQARKNVTVYQQEAAEALDKYFNEGGAIRVSETDSDEDILARAVLVARKTIERKNQQLRAKDARIMELEPKAQALDTFTNVEDKLLVRDAAKVLSNSGTPITEKQLREWMTANDWIYKHDCSWHATAKHCTSGHLVMVMSQKHGTKTDGTTFAFPPTVRITRKGLALLHTRLGETRLNETLETTIR